MTDDTRVGPAAPETVALWVKLIATLGNGCPVAGSAPEARAPQVTSVDAGGRRMAGPAL